MVYDIALCDDDKRELEKTEAKIQKWLLEKHTDGNIKCFESGNALMSAIDEGARFHLYILDVLMPGPSGIETGELLQKKGAKGEIIYLSSSKEYAAESYDVNAFYYLVKPVSENKLFEILDKATARLQNTKNKSIIVATETGNRHIAFNDILYVERVNRHSEYTCVFGRVKSNTIRGAFREAINPLLSDRRFFMCGASFVINLSRVTTINNGEALLSGGFSLTLPKAYVSDFKRAWGEYWLEDGDV